VICTEQRQVKCPLSRSYHKISTENEAKKIGALHFLLTSQIFSNREVHIYIYIYIYIYTHTHTHARTRARARTHTHTHPRTYARAHTHTHTHTPTFPKFLQQFHNDLQTFEVVHPQYDRKLGAHTFDFLVYSSPCLQTYNKRF
jgi:hypothetical protein